MIIGITGKKGVGKTTFANFIKDVFHDSYVISFSDELKMMLLKAGLCQYKELYVKKTKKSRELMQRIGTEIFRYQVDPDYWVKKMEAKIKEIYKTSKIRSIIIDDVRFINEANYVKHRGIIVRVERTSLQDNDKHASETEQNKINHDICVHNDKGLKELRHKVVMLTDFLT